MRSRAQLDGLAAITTVSVGLGKTLQTISFLAYLKHYQEISGPHLVVVPKSTLQNWHREFKQWTPDFNIITLVGSKDECAEIIASRLIRQDFEVCITLYEMCLIEKAALKKFSFEYIVIDEAHRIKQEVTSMRIKGAGQFGGQSGTFHSSGWDALESRMWILPFDSFLKSFELLNFICPEIFVEYSDLDSFFA